MAKKIVFISFAHNSKDDRIFYHFSKTLSENAEVLIISTKEDFSYTEKNIKIESFNADKLSRKQKADKTVAILQHYKPDIIIADTPLAVIAAKKIKNASAIYDITEWFPSKIILKKRPRFVRLPLGISLALLNYYAAFIADGLIFGEYYKSLPFKILFRKKKTTISYFPDTHYIQKHPISESIEKNIKLLYSGVISREKGIENILNAIQLASKVKTDALFHLTIIGFFLNEVEKNEFYLLSEKMPSNVKIEIQNYMNFEEYGKKIGAYDLYFDLRQTDFENTHCLPIKIFSYIAVSRPVIYSNLRSIRKEINNMDFGFLCEPENAKQISEKILLYMENREVYLKHCAAAEKRSTEEFNWQRIQKKLRDFIHSF